jgi:threonyl-tRNA synthetase
MQFYQFFYQYANLNIIEDNDQRYVYLREFHDLNNQNEYFQQTQKNESKEKRSLGRLLGLSEFQKKAKD